MNKQEHIQKMANIICSIKEAEYDRGYDAGREFQSWYDLSTN